MMLSRGWPILLLVVAIRATDDCTVSSWSVWGPCETTQACATQGRSKHGTPRSFNLNPPIQDSGRRHMADMVQNKTDRWTRQAACRDRQDCPGYMDRPSDTAHTCHNGLAGDLPCWNIDQLSFLNIWDLGYQQHPVKGDFIRHANDIWGWTDRESGDPENVDEYALIGLTGATSFVRITDPENPVTVGFLPSESRFGSIWRDIKVIGNYAYIVAEAMEHGLQVFDLTQLRGRQSLQLDTPTATHKGFENAHNVIANEETGYIYVVGIRVGVNTCNGGLYVLNVQDPLNPVFEGCFGDDGYTHDAQCVVYRGPDVDYQEHEVCFCYNENTLTLVDVTDKSNMTMISRKGYEGSMYTHQGWITEDQTLLLLDDEIDEWMADDQRTKTYIWDINDLDEPVLRDVYIHGVHSIDHNQYILGDYVYQANYQIGLIILHIDSHGFTLRPVAYFDVFPLSNKAAFNGIWSVYPFFPSGNLVLSSIEYGLFVVRPDWAVIETEAGASRAHAEKTRVRDLLQKMAGATCPPLTETETCEADRIC